MSVRQLVVLGTASQSPTRQRAHNGFVLRWDEQLIMFDPGEGAQRQCILAGVAVSRLTAVCITHFHGDHVLGLPGVIQRRALDARSTDDGLPPLPIFFPGDGQEYFERMRQASIFYDTSNVEARPVDGPGPLATLGQLTLSAQPLVHRVTTYGYRLVEPDRRNLVPEQLEAHGIMGPDVGRLLRQGWFDTSSGRVTVEQVSEHRRGQSMAFIMDTVPCPGAMVLASDADLAVLEATYLHRDVEMAEIYEHLTARQAAELARDAGVRRLVLGHFSARYEDGQEFAREAADVHPDVVAVEDLDVIDLPPR